MKNIESIPITTRVIQQMNAAIRAAISFEEATGKQLNITSTVGEILACKEHKLRLVLNDINAGFDAIDSRNKKVQIKTRRYKGNRTAQTGALLDKNGDVPFDYALLVLLNVDYSLKSISRINQQSIKAHFKRINAKRKKEGRSWRKTMSISQFENLAKQ